MPKTWSNTKNDLKYNSFKWNSNTTFESKKSDPPCIYISLCIYYIHRLLWLSLWGWREVAEPGARGRHPTSGSSTFHLTPVANSPSNIQHLLRQTDICPSHGLQIPDIWIKYLSLNTWIHVLIDTVDIEICHSVLSFISDSGPLSVGSRADVEAGHRI